MRGKRRGLVLVMCIILLGSQPLGAGAKGSGRKRVETKDYVGTSPVVSSHVSGFYASACTPGGAQDPWEASCLQFELKPKDRYILLKIQDASGQPIYGIVWGDDTGSSLGSFCGETTRPIPNPGGDFILVEVVAANTAEGCYPSVATEGTVTATFTQKKR